jgi:hypothetical protein
MTHHLVLNTRSTIYATSRAGTAYWEYSTGVIFRFMVTVGTAAVFVIVVIVLVGV